MDDLNIYVEQQMTRVSYKILEPNLAKRNHLNSLAENYSFEIWEMYCGDNFVTGTLVFSSFIDAYTFCREGVQCSYLEFKNFWFERFSGKIASVFLREMTTELDDDCVDEIAKRLDVVGMADLISVKRSARLIRIAKQRFSNLCINKTTVGDRFGLMDLRYVLHVFGDIFTNISICIHPFRGGARNQWNSRLNYGILRCICKMTGPELKSVNLHNFEIERQYSKYNSLILILQERNVVLNMN